MLVTILIAVGVFLVLALAVLGRDRLAQLFTIGKNKVGESVDAIVDDHISIKREGQASIKNLENRITRLRSSIVSAETSLNLQRDELKMLGVKINEFLAIAKRSIQNGDEADARKSLRIVEVSERKSAALEKAIGIVEPLVNEQLGYLEAMIDSKNELASEIVSLDLIYEANKTKIALQGGTGSGGGVFDIEALRERVAKAEALVQANQTVSERIDSPAEESLTKLQRNISIDDRLAKMKAEL